MVVAVKMSAVNDQIKRLCDDGIIRTRQGLSESIKNVY
jgi:hypothetical protein